MSRGVARRCLWSCWRSACVECTLWCALYSEEVTYSNPLRPYRDIDSFILPDWQPVTFHRDKRAKAPELSGVRVAHRAR